MHPSTVLLPLLSLSCFAASIPQHNFHFQPLKARQVQDINPLNRHSHWHGWNTIKRFFVFGDSYTANGFDPTGIQPNSSFPGQVSLTSVNGSSSNGPNWAEFLTISYNQSQIMLYDLAVPGSVVNKQLAPELFDVAEDFTEQVAWKFMPNYGVNSSVKWSTEHSLFASFFGINDIVSVNNHMNESLWDAIFESYFAQYQILYKAGARNFLILNAPTINRTPDFNSTDVSAQAYSELAVGIAEWNGRVEAMAYKLLLSYTDTTVFLFDTNKVFNQALDYQGSYFATAGLADTTHYCPDYQNGGVAQDYKSPNCSYAINQYFWLNGLHPTWAIHDVMAEQISMVLSGNAWGAVTVT